MCTPTYGFIDRPVDGLGTVFAVKCNASYSILACAWISFLFHHLPEIGPSENETGQDLEAKCDTL